MADGHDPAEGENTGGGDVAPPERDAAAERQQWVARGIQEGVKRTLQKLGLGNDLDTSLESLEQLKTAQEQQAAEPAGAGDVRETEEFRSLAGEHRRAVKAVEQLQQQVEQLSRQADEARLEKLRSAALARGVGPGQQVEAFVRLFGDRVRFGQDRGLEVLSDLPDGTMAAAGQSLDEFLDGVLASNKFLLAPVQEPSGAGSRQEPVQETKKSSLGLLEQLRGRTE